MIEGLNKIDETLIANVTAELEKRGWNQSELARRIGRERMVITRLMKHAVWDSELLSRLASVFEIHPDALLAEEQPISPFAERIELYNTIPALNGNEVRALLISVREFIARKSDPKPVKKGKDTG